MAICKWCGEENADGVNVCSFCGQDMSVFEDSSVLKNINPVGTAANEASRPRINVGAATNGGGATMNSGSFSASAVRAGAAGTGARNQQPQKKAEYVTRNQLKQVAFRLDQKSKTLTILTAIVAVGTVAAVALGTIAFLRSGANQVTDTKADAAIAQLQSQVSTLELELQSVTAKLEEVQNSQQQPARVDSQPDSTGGSTTGGSTADGDDSGVHITEDGDEPTGGGTTGDASNSGDTAPTDTGLETGGGSTTEVDTEIDATFEKVDGDGTSIYALVNQSFEGTTTYQWQKSANRETWTDVNTSAAKTAKLKISIDDYLRNNAYRCRITNVDSKGVTTVYYTEIVDYNAYEIWKLIN